MNKKNLLHEKLLVFFTYFVGKQWKVLSRWALMLYMDRRLGTSNVMHFYELDLRKFSLSPLARCRKHMTGWFEVTCSGAAVLTLKHQHSLENTLEHIAAPDPEFLSQKVGAENLTGSQVSFTLLAWRSLFENHCSRVLKKAIAKMYFLFLRNVVLILHFLLLITQRVHSDCKLYFTEQEMQISCPSVPMAWNTFITLPFFFCSVFGWVGALLLRAGFL